MNQKEKETKRLEIIERFEKLVDELDQAQASKIAELGPVEAQKFIEKRKDELRLERSHELFTLLAPSSSK